MSEGIPDRFQAMINAQGRGLPDLLVTVALGNGFIVTAMLWGAIVAKLIDGRIRAAAIYVFICAAMTWFGLIHSALPDGNLYLPWTLAENASRIPNQFTVAYLALAILFLALSFLCQKSESADGTSGTIG